MESFRIDIPDAELHDLAERLRRTRWPNAESVSDWSQGIPLDYVRELCGYWAGQYDWRAREALLNEIPQFRTELDGLGIHFAHVRSPHEDALPLVLTHGWPGSLVEFTEVIGPLTDPTAYGGDAADAFHLVCPTLPGYGFSDRPARTGWSVPKIAEQWAVLMSRLGYARYGAHGGDWGSFVTPHIANADPERVAGIHVTMPVVPRPENDPGPQTEREQQNRARSKAFRESGSGYSALQSTRPQTLGYGLADSPAAQCAWIVEKFYAWSDCDGHPENVFSRDQLLDNVMLYWLPNAGASSARLYWESFGVRGYRSVAAPTGCSLFAKEMVQVPRRWAEQVFSDLRFWAEHDRGGHFASLEVPDLLVADLREFFRPLR